MPSSAESGSYRSRQAGPRDQTHTDLCVVIAGLFPKDAHAVSPLGRACLVLHGQGRAEFTLETEIMLNRRQFKVRPILKRPTIVEPFKLIWLNSKVDTSAVDSVPLSSESTTLLEFRRRRRKNSEILDPAPRLCLILPSRPLCLLLSRLPFSIAVS